VGGLDFPRSTTALGGLGAVAVVAGGNRGLALCFAKPRRCTDRPWFVIVDRLGDILRGLAKCRLANARCRFPDKVYRQTAACDSIQYCGMIGDDPVNRLPSASGELELPAGPWKAIAQPQRALAIAGAGRGRDVETHRLMPSGRLWGALDPDGPLPAAEDK